MKISIGLPPRPEVADLARLAESLGFDRLWLFDSAALYEDLWIHLALAAQATERIGLGTGVMVPGLREVMTTASAIATIDRLAPGRLACAVGTGGSARMALGKRAMTWKATRAYVEQLRGLLRGDVVMVDGEACQMIHQPEITCARPIEVPFLLSAFGPKGLAIAKEIADGFFGLEPPPEAFDWAVQMIGGTVLDPGESPSSDRVLEATGPHEVVLCHTTYAFGGDAGVDALAGGAAWRNAVVAERPDGQRHLAIWDGHVSHLTDRDREWLRAQRDAGAFPQSVWVGTAEEIRKRIQASKAAGVSEISYAATGPDLEREIRSFAEAAFG